MRTLRRAPIPIILALVISAVFAAALPWVARVLRPVVTVSDIAAAEGRSFIGKLSDPRLSDHELPTHARLYMIEVRRGTMFHHIDEWCAASYACSWINALLDANYPYATYSARVPLGPGGALHKDIADKGEGRYSVWHGHLYFSLPPGKYLTNVSRLELEPQSWLQLTFAALAGILGWIRDLCAVLLCIWVAAPGSRKFLDWTGRNVLPGATITLVMLGTIAAGAEIYFRKTQKFTMAEASAPVVFDPVVGFVFKPGSIIKHTNGMDFWTITRANSLGFSDAEPALPKPPGTFRIVVVGDSFIEASQVSIEQKLQTLLAGSLRKKFPERKLDVVALGMSGAGQANELPFYERSRRELAADLVILVFVNNDFANNSALLEAVRQGWDPDHVPQTFMRPDCARMPISQDWDRHLLPASSYVERARLLRARSRDVDLKFGSWTGAESMDWMFYADKKLSPVFEDALASTKCAFAEWKRLAQEDGFALFVVATEHVAGTGGPMQIRRLSKMLDELNLPLLDLYPEFLKRDDIHTARWKFDGHWTPTGHRWAADAIANYIDEHGMLRAP